MKLVRLLPSAAMDFGTRSVPHMIYLDILCIISFGKLRRDSLIAVTHFSEQSPPLPVPQLQVSSTISLDNLHCSQLLLSLGKGSAIKNIKQIGSV